MLKISPSILAADPLNLAWDIRKVTEAGCDWLHIDVMDAHFVPNLAYTPDTVRRLKAVTDVPLDVHLMMDRPEEYIDTFIKAGADILTIHVEAHEAALREKGEDIYGEENRKTIRGLLDRIRSAGVKAGLSLKPGTPAEAARPFFGAADMILTMTVEPGFGGQKLNPAVLDKIAALREMGYTGEIEADGGVTEENLPELVSRGLTVAVMGTGVFRTPDPAAMIRELREIKA